ncbi:14908_t:CDS:1 [Cetraspora pellucida]|uniref:14908_t:CDS:1 n=1 Tax=Cetraspora pellucida TaxID=1433469 RepID=A0ACA9LFE7_9GLOM|nr:14908_t:CDS:1 [Cetraspora pellucida]
MSTIKRNYEDDELPSKNVILFKKLKQDNHYVSKPEVILIIDSDDDLGASEVDSDDDLPSEDEILFNKLNQEIHNVRTQEVISITDSDDDLPSEDEILFKKINQGNHYVGTPEVILITDSDDELSTTAANNNNNDFMYIINNDHSLRISKKEIRGKLKRLVRRLKTKKVIKHIANICEYKERYKYYNDFKSLSKWQLNNMFARVQRINHLVPGYYGMKGYTIMLEHLMKNTKVWKPKVGQKFIEEVIIPELGVRFIMEDLGVSDYDTAVKITRESIEYGNQHFFGDRNDECFW